MAWSPDYVTAAELKSWLRIGDVTDDTLLGIAITTASRSIDAFCHRQFGQITTAAARYYTWDGQTTDCRSSISIDDLYTTTDLVVSVDTDGDGDSTLTNSTDFDLWPANAAADGAPWTRLVLRRVSAAQLNRYSRGVVITARWGWSAVPVEVKQATLMQAARLFARRNAPFGVAGSPEIGSELRLLERLDADIAPSIKHLVRPWVAPP